MAMAALIGIPEATVASTYGKVEFTGLEELRDEINSLHASSGGDRRERQLRALRKVLLLNDSDGLPVMTPGSEIILLTDADSHDAELEDVVIALAKERKVCISFYLSRRIWDPYPRIAEETGGVIVHSIVDHSYDPIRNFDDVHDHGQCERFYVLYDVPGPLKKKRAAVTPSFSTEQRCHRFTVSFFATSLTVQGFTSQPVMIVTRPDSEVVQVRANIMGNKVYRETKPTPGEYSVCVETGTLTVSLDITDSMSSIFQFLTQTEDTFSLKNSPPPACKLLHIELNDTCVVSHTHVQVVMEQCQLKHHRLPTLRACPSNL